jgi:hypothetical protein
MELGRAVVEAERAFVPLAVRSGEDAALSTGNDLVFVEGEAAEVPDRSQSAAPVAPANTACWSSRTPHRPRWLPPKACAASSMTSRPCWRAKPQIAVMSADKPSMWTGMIARVLGPRHLAASSTSRPSDSSILTMTGTAPTWVTAFAVATNV